MKKPEFKRHFYLNWFVHDWLGDQNLKLCPPDAKGFWMDLLMQMSLSFPFGHLSRLSKPMMKQSGHPLVQAYLVGSLVYQNPDQKSDQPPNQSVRQLVDQSPGEDSDLWVGLSVGLPYEDQLTVSVSLEAEIAKLTGYPQDKIENWMAILDDLNVFSRTPSGVIYSRRMHRDFRRRVTAFVNACKGVNPYALPAPKTARKAPPKILVHQNPDQNPDQSADQAPDQKSAQLPHQSLSNSNSNSNSNYSNSIKTDDDKKDRLNTGKTSDEEKKQQLNGSRLNVGGSGSGGGHGGNGGKPLTMDELKGFKKKLLSDQTFIESIYVSTKIAEERMPAWVDLFHVNLATEGKLDKDYNDYRKHFRNWLYTKDYTKAPPSAKEIKNASGNLQASSTLLSKYSTI